MYYNLFIKNVRGEILKKIILCITISLMFCVTACNNKTNNEENNQSFKDDIKNAINLVKSDSNVSNPVAYVLSDGYISGFDGNNELKYFDFKNDNVNYGVIYVNEENKIYASLENDKYCAIKDFDDEDFTIYSLDEEEKCHKFYTVNSEISLNITPLNLETNDVYKEGTVSNGYISMLLIDNIIDDKAVDYTWYRNGEKIESSNVNNYVIATNYEDATYYVEVKSADGQTAKSNSLNIQIYRNE